MSLFGIFQNLSEKLPYILKKMRKGFFLNIIKFVEFNIGEAFGSNHTGIIELGLLKVILIIGEILIQIVSIMRIITGESL